MRVLLLDDSDDAGDTLQPALTHLRDFSPVDICVAVLHHKSISTVVPDYYAKNITQWRWITYPWAITEDLLGPVKKMRPAPVASDDALVISSRDELKGTRIGCPGSRR
jgi:hypoxanthine phosphoribosyltransferase